MIVLMVFFGAVRFLYSHYAQIRCVHVALSGWCYIHAHYNKKWKRLGWMFFSYELWVSGSMLWILVMVVLFCIILCATRLRVSYLY